MFNSPKLWLVLACLTFSLGGCGLRSSPNEQALKAGYDFLAQIQRPDGAICDTINPLFDVWETALAARSMYAISKDTTEPALKRALAFLRANENAAGLVCHNRKCRASYCLETSAIYLELLATIHGKAFISARLETIRSMQQPDGAWEVGNPDVNDRKDFPSVTGFVLGLLEDHGNASPADDSAYHWLVSQQMPDGSWGKTWEYYNLDGYALWPICHALARNGNAQTESALKKAVQFIHSTQQGDGSWLAQDPAFPKMPSPSLHTSLMLAALQASGQPAEEAISRGLADLLTQQRPDGSWDGGYFPIVNLRYEKAEYVMATSLAMWVLSEGTMD